MLWGWKEAGHRRRAARLRALMRALPDQRTCLCMHWSPFDSGGTQHHTALKQQSKSSWQSGRGKGGPIGYTVFTPTRWQDLSVIKDASSKLDVQKICTCSVGRGVALQDACLCKRPGIVLQSPMPHLPPKGRPYRHGVGMHPVQKLHSLPGAFLFDCLLLSHPPMRKQ